MLFRFLLRTIFVVPVALFTGAMVGVCVAFVLESFFPGEGLFYSPPPRWKVLVIGFSSALIPSYSLADQLIPDDVIDKGRSDFKRGLEAMEALKKKQRQEIEELKAKLKNAEEDG